MNYHNETLADARTEMMNTLDDMRNYELKRMMISRAQRLDDIYKLSGEPNPEERKRAFELRKAAREAELAQRSD